MNKLSEVMLEVQEVDEKKDLPLRVWKWRKKLITAAVVIVVAIAAIGVLLYQGDKINKLIAEIAEKEKRIEELLEEPIVVNPVAPEIELSIIDKKIEGIAELSTVKYFYTNAARFSDSKQIKNWNIPFTEKSFMLKWDGVIKAGINVDEVRTELDEADKVLRVYLPAAMILSHDPDKDSVKVLDEKDGLFNPVRVDDQIKLDAATEKEMESRAIENGLLEDAEKNAKAVIENLLSTAAGIEEYRIEFISDKG